jgi:hypothetical protein
VASPSCCPCSPLLLLLLLLLLAAAAAAAAAAPHLQMRLKKPSRCAFLIISPRSSRMARINWNSQMDASTRSRRQHKSAADADADADAAIADQEDKMVHAACLRMQAPAAANTVVSSKIEVIMSLPAGLEDHANHARHLLPELCCSLCIGICFGMRCAVVLHHMRCAQAAAT